MHVHPRWAGGAVLVAALAAVVLSLACAGPKASAGQAKAGPTHPEVDSGLETCFMCHTRVTPQVAAQWKDGRHGMALVECLVCHGSTGADFRARPQPTGCRSCHPSQAASAASGGQAPSCFGCHPAHSLRAEGASPHVAAAAREGRP